MSENPGFQPRITAAGLNYANEEAITKLSKNVRGQKINIPPGKSGSVSYSITDAEITEFSPPSSSSLKPIAGCGLKWSASDIGLAMRGNFKYSFKHKLFRISDRGSFKISVSGVSFSVQADFGVDTTGRPSIRTGSCTSDLGKVSTKFYGKWAWAYNAFRGQLGGKIESLLKHKMCNLTSRLVNIDAQKSLSLLKITVGIGDVLELSYKLTGPPQFTSDYMETYHKGEIDWRDSPSPPPFQAPPLPQWDDTSRMMYLWLSDFMMNSLFYQVQHHDLLYYNLTAHDLPESVRVILNTTSTSSLCIGSFIPELQQRYPNHQVELRMRSTTMPNISVVDGSIETKMAGAIDLYVQPVSNDVSTPILKPEDTENKMESRLESSISKSADFILTMDTNMKLTCQISVVGQTMHYKVTNMTIAVSLNNSTIPNVREEALNFLIKNAVEIFIPPRIDELGKKGIPLPLGKVSLKNAAVVLLKNAVVIATDLVYHPGDKK